MVGVDLRVVMPVHNGGRFVRDAIESVLDDMPAGAEFVIVDDGSTDGSYAVVREFRERDGVIVLRNESARGVSRALNLAIQFEESPRFIAVAEHDDLVVPGRFAAQMAALESDSQLGAVAGEGIYIGPDGRKFGLVSVGPRNSEEFEELVRKRAPILIPHPSVMYRAEALFAAGLYRSEFDSAQDLELINRLVYSAGWEVRTLPGPQMYYRLHGSATSSSSITRQRAVMRYIKYANRADGPAEPFETWYENSRRSSRTRLRWARHDRGALHYRKAGLHWLLRERGASAWHLLQASVLHPGWVLMKMRILIRSRGA